MVKKTKYSSQYFQADLSLLKRVASKGDFRLLAAMIILTRFANGVPKTETEKPFSITYAGAKAISENLNCRWETGKHLQSELLLNGYITKLRQAKGKIYKINYKTLNFHLPVTLVDSLNGATAIIYRLNHAENYSESEKIDCLMFLLTCYKNLSMSVLGGFYSMFQEWHTETTNYDHFNKVIKLSAFNVKPMQAYNSFTADCLDIPELELDNDQIERFWKTVEKTRQLGLIYQVIVLRAVMNEGSKFLFTIRINDYHANQSDFSYINIAMDSNIAYYGNKDFNYDYEDVLFEPEMNLNDSTIGEKVIRLTLPNLSDVHYEVLTIYRPRFRFSHPDIALWQKQEEGNITNFLEEVESILG
ncbi:hypothetical protein [Rodentibacter pneumotropicus]|uniref:hypothetical protein n=1 Tax=Rodentibacter pneumotropicus TaxID=758 RepID=UPI000984ACF0|nr:hypothetical protein [Rodentibacter pneumotropicus]OOF62377.1 hypothetical protein BKL50_05920 [Rodentibacter pneumotropicus]THA19006.1 hypothetical protein D3M83_02375 [Rodentibacter pneumotropicus]